MQIIAELDGERVLRTDVHCGYLHRGFEKECEDHTWHNLIPYVDRLNYVSALVNDFAYCEAVEALMDITITPRCRYLRTLLSEYSRLADHLTCIAASLMAWGYAGCSTARRAATPRRRTSARTMTRYIGSINGRRICESST